MEVLDKGASIEEAKKILNDQNLSGMSRSMVRSIIFHFSSKGPEFYEKTYHGNISPELQAEIDAKKAENQKLAEKHAKKDSSRKHV